MKNKVMKMMLGLAMAASLGMTGIAPMAAETELVSELGTEAEAESEADPETESETETEPETEAAPDVEVKRDSAAVVTIKNEAGYVVREAVLSAAGSEENETENDETEAGTQAENLVITGEDGEVHTFESVELDAMTDPVLVEDNGFLYIRYTNADGEQKEAAETADEVSFDTPITMYVVNDVYVRAEASGDSEALSVASLGNEIQAIGATPKWYKVEQGDITGYVARAYLSKDKESADAAVKAEEAAIAQAQAEAAAAEAAAQAAAAQAAAQAQQNVSSTPQGRYEVSREAFDDCDGSGHGYYLITYSDGTTETEEY